MRTREESLNQFCKAVDGIIESKYLFANSGIYDVITVINSSKLLSDLFKYFTDGFDFYETYVNCLVNDGETKSFEMPVRDTDVLAFVYSLLREINYNRFQLADMLDYFTPDKNYEAGYKAFCQTVILPFKSFTYQIGMQVINSVQIVGEGEVEPKTSISTEDSVSDDVNEVSSNPVTHSNDAYSEPVLNNGDKVVFQRNIFRLLELDKLAIVQSHISRDDKEELIYVLDSFNKYLLEGDVEKIGLAYQVYYYALRSYKKIKTNLKAITEILVEKNILG
ncbi:MAG: hypothetical protein J6R88_04700 [Clostridia bacterium]|nr:hypothetical protein [Clostridia bacterium]